MPKEPFLARNCITNRPPTSPRYVQLWVARASTSHALQILARRRLKHIRALFLDLRMHTASTSPGWFLRFKSWFETRFPFSSRTPHLRNRLPNRRELHAYVPTHWQREFARCYRFHRCLLIASHARPAAVEIETRFRDHLLEACIYGAIMAAFANFEKRNVIH